jgi:hypothetical protein
LPAKCRWKRSKYKSGKEKKTLGGFSLTTVVTAATKGGSEFRICVGWSDLRSCVSSAGMYVALDCKN